MNEVKVTQGMRRFWIVAVVVALVLALAFGIARLFSLRFAQGDIYPPYSSLRTDPLGSKVLADAIDELPGFRVERNFRPASRLKVPPSATIAYLGIEYSTRVDEKEFDEVESMVKRGGRLIITFAPEQKRLASTPTPGPTTSTPAPASSKSNTAPAATPAPTPTPSTKPSPRPFSFRGLNFDEAAEDWGVSFDLAEDKERDFMHAAATPDELEKNLDPSVPWHTALYFKDLDPAWRTLYRRDKEPVVIERSFGKGSIILCTDSYFLSNEGLRTARAPRLLARIIGPPGTIIFDEYHNGVAENPNVAGLVRKHGLGSAVLALLGVAALFVWKNAVSFLPPRKTNDEASAHVVGFDASEGFINLLRRGVPPARVIAVCVDAWRKSRGHRIRDVENAHVESVLRAHTGRTAKDAAAAYRTIAAGLNRN
jgi:Domain of unknown function (DUF4350)